VRIWDKELDCPGCPHSGETAVKKPKRRTTRNAVILIGGILCVIVVYLGVFWWAFEPMHLRIRLLCRTNHEALLEACQELAKRVKDGKLEVGKYRFRPWPSRAVARFLQPIRVLRPTYVYIDGDGRVIGEMFGGFSHFGVHAYPEDYPEPFPGFEYGDRKLIPNLWYYDDDCGEDPNFDETIDALIKKYADPDGTR
jgi:hypothetical protein